MEGTREFDVVQGKQPHLNINKFRPFLCPPVKCQDDDSARNLRPEESIGLELADSPREPTSTPPQNKAGRLFIEAGRLVPTAAATTRSA